MCLFLKKVSITLGCAMIGAVGLAGCDSPEPEKQNITVRYMVTQEKDVLLTTELPGRVSAFMVSEVRPQVGGIIKERLFEEGTDVKTGQILYQIDPALFQAAYNNAKAELFKAESNVNAARMLAERYGKIVETDAVSKQEYDDAVAAYGQARGAVDAARQAVKTAGINLGYTRITAPVSGRIGRSFVTPGALVTQNQQQPLSTVQQLNQVYVDVTQSSTDLLKLRRAFSDGGLQSSGKTAAKVRLRLEDGSPYVRSTSNDSTTPDDPEWVEGDLLFSDITIEQTTGVVNIRARFNNPEHILLPNMYVRALIEEGVRKNAIQIPQKTVIRDGKGQALVHILTKNPTAQKEGANKGEAPPENKKQLAHDEFYVETRLVTIDRDLANNWLISDGLKAGELLLVDGLQKIKPGQIVSGVQLGTEPVKPENTSNNGSEG